MDEDSQPEIVTRRRLAPFVVLVVWLAGFLAMDAFFWDDDSFHWLPRTYVGATLIALGLRGLLRPPARGTALAARGLRPDELSYWLEQHPVVDRALNAVAILVGIGFIATQPLPL